MSYEFKKIADLERVTEVPEGATVLIETEGTTKRLPSTAINNGYSKEEVYTKVESDEKYVAKEDVVQSDFAQNDPEAADYVKNRTHYAEVSEETIIPEITIEFPKNSIGGVDRFQFGIVNFVLVAGDTYFVNWNGVTYECVAITTDWGAVYIGNGYAYDIADDTGEPFIVCYDPNEEVPCMIGHGTYDQPEGEVTVSVVRRGETIHKLDKKFLPDDVGGIKYVTIRMDDNDNYTASATYDEISEWIKAGLEVKCVYGDYVLCHIASPIMEETSTFVTILDRHTFRCEESNWAFEIKIQDDNTVLYREFIFATEENIPTTLPNPNALTINGVSYDGSAAVDVPAIQSDLSQNDPTAPDYVKNRTHWEDDDGTVHKLDKKFLPDGSNKVVIYNNSVQNEETGGTDYSFSSSVSYEDARRILMEDPTAAVLICKSSYNGNHYVTAETAYEVSFDEQYPDYFGVRFVTNGALSWDINGIQVMPE